MIKHKSMSELKDCLDLVHYQLTTMFHSKKANPKHVMKLSGWFDRVLAEIEHRDKISKDIIQFDSTNYLGLK